MAAVIPLLYAWYGYGKVYVWLGRTSATWLMLLSLLLMLWTLFAVRQATDHHSRSLHAPF